jgi:hypothetical protein
MSFAGLAGPFARSRTLLGAPLCSSPSVVSVTQRQGIRPRPHGLAFGRAPARGPRRPPDRALRTHRGAAEARGRYRQGFAETGACRGPARPRATPSLSSSVRGRTIGSLPRCCALVDRQRRLRCPGPCNSGTATVISRTRGSLPLSCRKRPSASLGVGRTLRTSTKCASSDACSAQAKHVSARDRSARSDVVPGSRFVSGAGTPACPRQRERRSCPRIVLLGPIWRSGGLRC